MKHRELVSILESERSVLCERSNEYRSKIERAKHFKKDHLFDILDILLDSYDRILLSLKENK